MTTGERIKAARIKKGWTQTTLAEKLKVTQSMIGQYERNERNPKRETLEKIADVLGVNVGELLYDGTINITATERHTDESIAKTFNRAMGIIGEISSTYNDERILSHFGKLNDAGQEKAIENVELLTKVPEYQNPVYIQSGGENYSGHLVRFPEGHPLHVPTLQEQEEKKKGE